MTIDLKWNRFRIHKSTLNKMGNPQYVQFLVSPEEIDVYKRQELKAVFSLKLTALLKLAVMVLLVLLVSNLVIFILQDVYKRQVSSSAPCSIPPSPTRVVRE